MIVDDFYSKTFSPAELLISSSVSADGGAADPVHNIASLIKKILKDSLTQAFASTDDVFKLVKMMEKLLPIQQVQDSDAEMDDMKLNSDEADVN